MNTDAPSSPTVFVVDDDPAIREAMGFLLDSVGLVHETFATADEFLAGVALDRAGCLVLDIRMPGLDGLELQAVLKERGCAIPIIFITGHGDVPMAVDAMQKGALDFIQKPFRDQELLDRIRDAVKADRSRRDARVEVSEIAGRLGQLTNREREVFDLVVKGKPNKIIAFELGVSQRTVEIHRARVMEKMQADSLAALVRMHLRSAQRVTPPASG